ncbi:hypothetical protein DFH08DRAFT_815092 [Mycena albidolilacea]|uniref:Uncharacterized protein n=1 Tax=Mycena albidolilacea TaxID=1033008 RepID=A0AAD6ZNP1_9AGAR|nr:hypothetical protein DFH08DRAFT_815092 [Mycena albidolilacea]
MHHLINWGRNRLATSRLMFVSFDLGKRDQCSKDEGACPLGLCISGAKRWILHHPKKQNDLNNGQEECFNEDMGQLEYSPQTLHRNTAFELDPALEPNHHALGGSDYAMADYNVSGSDDVLPLPPPSPPAQPPDTSAPSDTSGPS